MAFCLPWCSYSVTSLNRNGINLSGVFGLNVLSNHCKIENHKKTIKLKDICFEGGGGRFFAVLQNILFKKVIYFKKRT